ncbi:hypothetical protein RMQ97_08700 [Maricaulis sp. D1M11]|uniref:hypothetical protein n=1 Tax=Maricaulis sp. D1M11 TaxID=3076117 RepID=UPI0039B5E6D0
MRDTYMSQFSSVWSEEAKRDFRRTPIVVKHNYHEHNAFSDLSLAALLDRHPRDMIDFCTMGDDATDRDSWRAGDPGDLSGEALIDAVRHGKLWINIRHAMDTDDQYRPIFDAMLADMKRARPGFNPLLAEAGILISSPTAQVFLHSDVSETMLWHMRGVKRFRTYRPEAPYYDPQDMEAVLHKEQTEDIPFDPAWDADAYTVDLHPGMATNWPLHGPHRIENQSGLNVSVPFEISTPESRRQNAVIFANGFMRRHWGLNPSSIRVDGPVGFAKQMLTAGIKVKRKLFGMPAQVEPKSETTFEIDGKSDGGFIDQAA